MPRNFRIARLAPVLATLAAAALLSGCDEPEQSHAAVPERVLPVRATAVGVESQRTVSRYPAVIRPRVEAEIAFRVGGKVVERAVDLGDAVAPGSVLARLDPMNLEHEARAVAARLALARAERANAEAEFSRFARLHDKGWSSQQEFEQRRTVLDAASARIDELEAALVVARNNAGYATLVADAAGVVTHVDVEPGQVVQASRTVLRIAESGGIDAVAHIPEPQVALLRRAELEVELWARPDVRIAGRLRDLSPVADPLTRTFEAHVELVDPPSSVELGMTATLVLRAGDERALSAVPLSALLQDARRPAVWVVDETAQSVALRPVEVERYTADTALVRAGLEAGEKVVTAGVHKLSPAQRVRIWQEPDR